MVDLKELLNQEMDVFCNADWAGGADRKSTSGYIITIAGGAIAWSSKKQNSVALSTAKAEYIAVTLIGLKIEYPWIIHFSLISYSN